MKFILHAFFLLMGISALAQKNYYLLTGTYTKGKSKGIYVYDFNSRDGSLKIVDSVVSSNPSFLVVSPDQKFVYAVCEEVRGNRSGKIRAFSFDQKTGDLKFINEQLSSGDNPCYVTIDKKGKWVFVGNYTSGTLAVLPVQKDGSLGAAIDAKEHIGHGVNPKRQESPHVHSTVLSPDNQFLFVPDLGIDKIMIYAIDKRSGMLSPAKDSFVKLDDGSGPRHFEFHPSGNWAYLVQEMSGTITAFNYKKGKLDAFQTISALPAGFNQYFTSADIHASPDGKFLYSSNRDSSNTIAVFRIDQRNGTLTLAGHKSTLGRTPRNFSIDPTGNFLLVANQNSDAIVVFKINRETGMLTDTGHRIDVGNPVCLKWIKRKL